MMDKKEYVIPETETNTAASDAQLMVGSPEPTKLDEKSTQYSPEVSNDTMSGDEMFAKGFTFGMDFGCVWDYED